ncbi:pleckstrin homology domain-containing family S member 1 isoform X2 [Myxocyprinus asiaticus]|uniref:pleckstrin homology domain-containing family S member 1 isoform X2 n=1 Tax=Myxocyprinus asiaticus TaxID=70543 RepID=UPI0022222064|nr:pleckstrin homology domain-containing family S member 1 isoform X2 [Myxocyprinus asiaticus]
MANSNHQFYIHGAEEQVCAGYLYKSPPENQFKNQKSWKRRYFVLLKYSDHTCQLKYFKSENKNKSLGVIDLSAITFMFLRPEMHSMWKWIQNNFRCSPSCVLFIKVPERDYFLIGENSGDMDKWFTTLFDVLNNRPHRLLDPKRAEWELSLTKRITHELPSSVIHEPVYVSPVNCKKNQ